MPMIQSGHAVRPFLCCRVIGIASSVLNKSRVQYSILICMEMSCFVADRIS